MRRICFILPGTYPFPPTKGGAVEQCLKLFICENERCQRYSITVYSPYDESALKQSKALTLTTVKYIRSVSKLKYYKNPYIRAARNLYSQYFSTPYIRSVIRSLNEQEPFDLYIIEGGNYRDYYQLSNHIGSNKMVLHIHGISSPRFDPNKIFGSFIFVSQCAKDFWTRNFALKNSFVLLNGIDQAKFETVYKQEAINDLKVELGIRPDDFVLLYCGRLIEGKGVLELIRAMNQIDVEDIKLVIVGSSGFHGAGVTSFQKKVFQEAGKSGSILFTGYVDNDLIPLYYQMADVVVTPSTLEEAGSLVNIEVMASGRPLVTTSKGGNLEYVCEDGALVIDPKDGGEGFARSLRDAILSVYEHRSSLKEMGDQNKIRARSFTKENYYLCYADIIDSIIGKGAQS